MVSNHDHEQRVEDATRRRLAGLASLPVDTRRLEQRLKAAGVTPGGPAYPFFLGRRAAVGALAAMLTIALLIVLPRVGGLNTAAAAPIQLDRLHHDIVTGRLKIESSKTIDEVNRSIERQHREGPAAPGFEHAQVQSCCLIDAQGKLMSVAILDDGPSKVTLVVARAKDFGHNMGVPVRVDQRLFFGHEIDGVRMVMANQGDHWLCVMGQQTYQSLAQIASEIRY